MHPSQQVLLAIRTGHPQDSNAPAPDVVLSMTPVGSAISDETAGEGDDERSKNKNKNKGNSVESTAKQPAMPPTPPASVPAEPQQPKVSVRQRRQRRRHHRPRQTSTAAAAPTHQARPSAVLERLTAAQRARRWHAISVRLARVVGHLARGAVERAGAAMLTAVACLEQSMWGLGLLPAARYRAALRRHGRIGVPWRVVGAPAKRAFWLRLHALARALFDEHTRRVHAYNAVFAIHRADADGDGDGDDNNDHHPAPPRPPPVLSTQTLVRLHKAVGVLHARLYGGRRRKTSPAHPRRGPRAYADLPPRTLFRSLAETVLFQIDNTTQQPPSATTNLWV